MRPASSSYIGEIGSSAPGGFMRSIFSLPLMALVAVVAGCGSTAREQAAPSSPQRDLTLVSQTAQVEIASPVELRQVRAARRPPARRSSPLEPRVELPAVAAPFVALGTGSAPVLAAPERVAQPAGTASTSDNSRELPPGKTVTVIPASSGPSIDPDRTDELPVAQGRTMVARGGGGACRGRGRGPGIGIAGAPRPDFR